MKQNVHVKFHSEALLEELEARQLFSGGLEGILVENNQAEAAVHMEVVAEPNPIESSESIEVTAAESISQELVFIDTDVDNYQELLNDILVQGDEERNIEVILLDNQRDGIEQISETLANFQNLDAVHLISHGSDGRVDIGNTQLDADTLNQNLLEISSWGDAFSEQGDFLIYGCNLAETEDGQSLVQALSSLTHTDVAASDDITGHESLGGDWELEYQAGEVETTVAVSEEAQQSWLQTLATATDDFISGNYTGGSGWSSDWIEVGGDGNFTSGAISVNTNQLVLADGETESSVYIYRTIDLSGATSASLEFDWGRDGESWDNLVSVGISTDGTNWTQLMVLADGSSMAPIHENIDISAYASATTYIRFERGGWGTGDHQVDNVVVTHDSGANAAPEITTDGGGATANVNVVENTTSVTTVTATDADLDTVTYSISGGADAALFSINSSTGELAFNTAPDFENPADANTDNVYEVTVQASDGTDTDTQAISVTVTNQTEVETTYRDQFDTAAYNNSDGLSPWTTSWTETGDDGSATAGDLRISGGALHLDDISNGGAAPNASVQRGFDLTGASTAKLTFDFDAHGAGGIDTFAVEISNDGGSTWIVLESTDVVGDLSGNRSYVLEDHVSLTNDMVLRFRIVQGFGAAPQQVEFDNVQIAFTDSDVPFIINDGAAASASISVPEGTTTITTIDAIDANNGIMSYSITGGADAALFSINSSTGELTFNTAPNFEAPADANADNVYEVQVTAADGVDGADVQTLNITVTDVAEVTYPASSGSNNSYEWITNVSFAGINNSSTADVGGYADYTAQSGSIVQGQDYQLSVTINSDSQTTSTPGSTGTAMAISPTLAKPTYSPPTPAATARIP